MTMSLLVGGYQHQLVVMKFKLILQNIFCSSLTVSAGEARQIITDQDSGFTVQSGIESDIFIEISDSRGNLAPAETISTNLNSTIGELVPSIAGRGYWTFVGNAAGEYSLTFFQDEARHTIQLIVEPGEAVQLFGEIEARITSKATTLLRVYGVVSITTKCLSTRKYKLAVLLALISASFWILGLDITKSA